MIPARPTTYNGIRMRSRLEARFAAKLDEWRAQWTYEPLAYANAHGQYLPDFRLAPVLGDDGSIEVPPAFIEVRPTWERGFLALTSMQIIWDSEPSALLLITVPESPMVMVASGKHRHWHVEHMDVWS